LNIAIVVFFLLQLKGQGESLQIPKLRHFEIEFGNEFLNVETVIVFVFFVAREEVELG